MVGTSKMDIASDEGGHTSEEDASEEEEEASSSDESREYNDFLVGSGRSGDAKSQRRSPRQKKPRYDETNPSWIFANGLRNTRHTYSFRSSQSHSLSKSSRYMEVDEDDDDDPYDDKTVSSPYETRRRSKHKSLHRNKKDHDDEDQVKEEEEDDKQPTPSDDEDNSKESDEAQLISSTRVTRFSRHRVASPTSANNNNDSSHSQAPSATNSRYPRRRGTDQESESVLDTPTENGSVRRSQRTPKPVTTNGLDAAADSQASEDMYTRLKGSHSRRQTRTSVNFNESQRVISSKRDSCEPVARRLRERKARAGGNASGPSLMDNLLEMDRKRRHRRKRKRRSSSSDSSSSDNSSMDELVTRGNRPRQSPYDKPEKVGSKKGFLDITPITVDPTISFESVGGLGPVIEKLREIVLLPLIYKDYYTARNITPPRGILFHGPPGTGKTLLARALANECSEVGGRKVSFFVRKGADLLNKWVGESERHLRQLFEAASRCQPSIIFFDEIDGLAPARSSKTDQIHNSVVSTLLAELDGVQDRGDVIIIGATNRIDSVDPALRRPGRFDHEFPFLLPTKEGRVQIIKSHVGKWSDNVTEEVTKEVARRCVGFSGADLKLLCAEASMCALRRCYPQIFSSKQKFLLNYESVKVGPSDWHNAMKKVSRSADRSVGSTITAGKPLPKAVAPLLGKEVESIQFNLKKLYSLKEDDSLMREPAPKRFLIYTKPDHEDNGVDQYIVPAVLHIFESVPVFTLSLESFSLHDTNADCKTIAQVFAEAARVNKFAIVLIPSLNVILKMISEQCQEVLYQRMMSTEKPILVLATAQPYGEDLSDSILKFFNGGYSREVAPAGRKERKLFFQPIFSVKSLRVRVKTVKEEQILEELPLAPPPPPNMLSEEELKFVTKKETSMLRSLRKFLREVLAKLARNKKYCDFTTPVDLKDVPDYRDIIDNPMDFETMMCKLDQGIYNSAAEFLEDIHLIRDNAVTYNPANTFDGKSIIHRAHELVDYSHLIIEDEMDSDFEEACQNIPKRRQERAAQAAAAKECQVQTQAIVSIANQTKVNNSSKTFVVTPSSDRSSVRPVRLSNDCNKSPLDESGSVATKKRRKKKMKRVRASSGGKNDNKLLAIEWRETTGPLENGTVVNNDSDDVFEDSISTAAPDHAIILHSDSDSDAENSFTTQFSDGIHKFIKCTNFQAYKKDLQDLLNDALTTSENMGVLQLLDFRYQLMYAVEANYDMEDKKKLLGEFQRVIKHFATI